MRHKPFRLIAALVIFFFSWTNLGIYNLAYAATSNSGKSQVAKRRARQTYRTTEVVRFYQGDPSSGGIQIGADQIIQLLAHGSSAQVSITNAFTGTDARNLASS